VHLCLYEAVLKPPSNFIANRLPDHLKLSSSHVLEGEFITAHCAGGTKERTLQSSSLEVGMKKEQPKIPGNVHFNALLKHLT